MSKITVTVGQFLLMSETHLKMLASQGITVGISDTDRVQPKVDNKQTVVATTTVDSKPSTKGGKKSKKVASKEAKKNSTKGGKAKKELAFGKVNVGDFFKVINLKTNKTSNIGKAKEVSEADVTTTSGRLFKKANCVAITEASYNKLQKKFGKKENKLPADVYKTVYMRYLASQGKITEQELNAAVDNAERRSELCKQFKDTVQFNNDMASKFLAEHSAKAAA